MNRIRGEWALVTGASAGIGAATARRLANDGVNVVLWARRVDRLEALKLELESRDVRVRVAAVDVRDRAAVEESARELALTDASPYALINNAGLAAGFDLVQEGDPDDWDRMIDTNVKGMLYVTRAFLPGMIERNRGHIINMGSSTGRWTYARGAVYAATKFAVRALNEGISIDTIGTSVRVSSVDPGFVETEFSTVRFHGDRERAASVYKGFTPLSPDDIADVILYILNAPPHVNLFETYVLPTAQRIGPIVHREDG